MDFKSKLQIFIVSQKFSIFFVANSIVCLCPIQSKAIFR